MKRRAATVRRGLAASIFVLSLGGSAAAQVDKYHISPAEHVACDQDAIRLCSETYPDEDMLHGCMRSKRDQLSPTCLAAFEAGLQKRHLKM